MRRYQFDLFVTLRAFVALVACFLTGTSQPSLAQTAVDDRTALSPLEISRMFSGQTWNWPEGSAYFGRKGLFQATKNLRETASGKWFISQSGELCAKAQWKTLYTNTPFSACWAFSRNAEGAIWISQSAAGSDWHPFDPKTELSRGDVKRYEFDYASIPRKFIVSRFLRPREVEALYTNKAWLWDDGLALFGRLSVFNAATGKGEKAEGRWFVESEGKLCYEAVWSGPSGSTKRKECWQHALDKHGRLWQTPANVPEGWYVFNVKSRLKPIKKSTLDAFLHGYDANRYQTNSQDGS